MSEEVKRKDRGEKRRMKDTFVNADIIMLTDSSRNIYVKKGNFQCNSILIAKNL